MTTLGKLVDKGPTHHLIGYSSDSRGTHETGAFLIHPKSKTKIRENPSIWDVQAKSQTSITCRPTHYGEPRSTPDKAREMLVAAGHIHLSRGLRTSANKVAVAFTDAVCMGGRSWNTIKTKEIAPPGTAEAIILFLNSAYGILIRAGYGQSSDLGRCPINVNAIDGHPIPDFAGAAAVNARRIAAENFDRLRQLPLERIALAAIDPHRREIDRIVTLMLGLPWDPAAESMLDLWRRLLCLQPAINARNQSVLTKLKANGIGQ